MDNNVNKIASFGLKKSLKGINPIKIALPPIANKIAPAMYPSKVADARMRMFNLDGSEGKMCGNGIRCVAKFLRYHGLVEKDTMTIETLSGILTCELLYHYGEIINVRVNMGKAVLEPKEIPVNISGSKIVDYPAKIGGDNYNITCVSTGNPHCVVFTKIVDTIDIEKIGPKFEFNELFPERVNTEFIQVINNKTLKMRVWERGSGETQACGTGACAAVVAAVENGICPRNEDVTVKLKGGDLNIKYTDDGTVYLTGNAEIVFKGTVII